MANQVVIFSDEKGWHTGSLQKEFFRRGVKTRCIDLADCFFEIKKGSPSVTIPGFGKNLPELGVVRGISGGSLEQITKRLSVLHLLSMQGVPIINKALAIEKSVDKGTASFILKKNNIPTPQFWVTESPMQAKKIISDLIACKKKIVMKPLFGSQGQGLQLFESSKNISDLNIENLKPKGNVFYLQQFVDFEKHSISHDYRVIVVKNKALAAMRRVGKTWIHNRALGAKCEKCNPSSTLKILAVKAAKVLGLDIAGVDLIPDSSVDEGYQVIEVNGIPAWRGIQSVTDFNITSQFVDFLIKKKSFSS